MPSKMSEEDKLDALEDIDIVTSLCILCSQLIRVIYSRYGRRAETQAPEGETDNEAEQDEEGAGFNRSREGSERDPRQSASQDDVL